MDHSVMPDATERGSLPMGNFSEDEARGSSDFAGGSPEPAFIRKIGPRSIFNIDRGGRSVIESDREGGESVDCKIDDLLTQVPEGETRLFEAPVKGIVEERFFSVHPSHEYNPRPEWRNRPSFERSPWAGSRTVTRIPISELSPPDVTFKGSSDKVVDFYGTGSDAYFVSDRLADLIESIDPGSLDRMAMNIRAKNSAVSFNVVMPKRNLELVDPARTDVLVKDENFGGQWFRSVEFPKGVVFRDRDLSDIQSFSDTDVKGWFWSRTLIEAAKKIGIQGLYTVQPGWIAGHQVDYL